MSAAQAISRPSVSRVAGLAVLLVALTVSGCAADPEPIAVGSAPAAPSERIDLGAAPAAPVEMSPVGSWPQACDLLTDADIRAVFPQAADIVREPQDVQLTVFGLGSFTVTGGRCTFRYSLPGRLVDPADTTSGYRLQVQVQAVGTDRFVAENHASVSRTGPVGGVPGADCSADVPDTAVTCATDRMLFDVRDMLGNVTQDGGWARFRQGDRITTFEGEDSARLDQQHEYVVRTALTEIARTIAAKL
ncbi:hypothetical protein [Pseudonocardia sp. HH130630-07]|uniref:hypothetical protein n=1 Tax=Pseudonocardia sp. HH130630-07 TaxID=1690815 RepID=UPI000814D190|nr:hypothetical protein [Pseudonocardia sp. HH130630-07]ANY09605.1 hypothetical protein AFB00_28985 [Pseudonocardia sp. HH130630-07]